MEFEESIYNLIPKEAYIPPKQKRHMSKHDPLTAPTSSTFCLNTTSKPGLSNLTGDHKAPAGSHTNQSNSASFGLPKGAAKPSAGTFRLKNTGTFKLPEGKTRSTFCQLILGIELWHAYQWYIGAVAQIFRMSNLS